MSNYPHPMQTTPEPRQLHIPVTEGPVGAISALFEDPGPGRKHHALLLAHGAGAGMDHPFMQGMAHHLVELGHPVLRFRYPYAEHMAQTGRRRPPDRMPVLEAAHLAAHLALRDLLPEAPQVFVGKSMGGRVGSHLAARGVPCVALAYLGYPLHPAGKPTKLRDEHFEDLTRPALFLQGTRDKLAELDLLRASLESYAGEVTLEIIQRANHGFQVPVKDGRSADDIHAELAAAIDAWLGGLD